MVETDKAKSMWDFQQLISNQLNIALINKLQEILVVGLTSTKYCNIKKNELRTVIPELVELLQLEM